MVIKIELTIFHPYIFSIGIANLLSCIADITCKWQSYFHAFLSAIYDSIQEHLKRSNQLLWVAIDIQMICIRRSHDGNIRMQGQEGAMIFIGFYHHYIIFSKKHVVLIVCTDSAQECRAIKTGMFQNM